MGSTVTDVVQNDKPIKHELKKHAATIHCSNSLSLLQRKISNALLYHAYQDLLSKEEHEINIKQLCRLISYNGNNHAAIKEALKGLLSTVIEWNVVNDTNGMEDWSASSILASVSLKGPVCLYAYSPRMKQLLHSPSMFGKINLFIQSRFKSSYGLALYENCIRYRGLPNTKWFDMDLFRKIMGVPDGNYTIFRDFKKRVLDKSIEEVNTYSDLIVEPVIYKEGRQVIKIRFNLKERAKKVRLGATGADTALKEELLSQFGLSNEQAEQLLSEYEEKFIQEKIELIQLSKNYQEGKIQNLPAYLLSALKNNYQVAASQQSLQEQKKLIQTKDEIERQQKKRYIDQVREAYLHYRESVIDNYLDQLPDKEKNVFFERFTIEASTSIETILKLQRKKYNRENLFNSPQIKALLRQFALKERPELHTNLMKIEAFIEKFSDDHKNAWQQFEFSDVKNELGPKI